MEEAEGVTLVGNKKEAETLHGRSLLPIARVQKIVKADKELPLVAREAVFAISVATEEFIKRLSEASQKQANREKRTIVRSKDVAVGVEAAVVKKADEFMFLEDVITADEDEAGNATKGGGKKRRKEDAEVVGQMDSFVERSSNNNL